MGNRKTRQYSKFEAFLPFIDFDVPFMRLDIMICLSFYGMTFAYSMFDSSVRFITFLVIIFVEHTRVIKHFFLIHYILKFQLNHSFHHLGVWIFLALFRSIAHLVWNYCYCFDLFRVLFNKWTEFTKPWSYVNWNIIYLFGVRW